MQNYRNYIARKMDEWGGKFDPSKLAAAPQFIPYYESGARIEVDYHGETVRGRVGVTTGWRPCFLLVLTRRSMGSSYTLSAADKVLRVINQ